MTDRKHPLAKCEECPWGSQRGFADADGPEDAELLFVGEAPGAVETRTGLPFSGPSGQLLDKVLAHHGHSRDQVRVTNVVACHPAFVPGKKPEVPPKEVIAACAPRLQAELKGRHTIVCLGNTAKEAVLETREAITKVRQGPPRRIKVGEDDVNVIATVHPAACLRQGDYFPSLVKDIAKINRVEEYSNWQPPKWRAYEEVDDALAVLNFLRTDFDGVVSLDIETDTEKDTAYTHPKGILCVGLGYTPGKAVVIGEKPLLDRRVLAALRALLERRKVVCHNGKFDLQVLVRMGILTEPGLWADTMLASYVLDERPGQHGLKGIATEVLGAPDYAAAIKKYVGPKDSYAVVPRSELYEYNAYDAAITYALWHDHFEPRLEEDGLRHVHDRLVRYSNTLTAFELDGVAVDIEYLDELTKQYIESLALIEDQLKPWVKNPRSVPQVAAALKELGLRAPDTTKETLEALLDRQQEGTPAHTFLSLMMVQRKEQKLYGTYVKGTRIRLIDGRVYPTYLIHGTTSGRLSCRNPNLQNVPRGNDIRRLFVPKPGNVFVQGDYAQAELRVIACEAEDEYLRGVLSDPSRDLHGEISERFYGPGWTKEQRVRAKAIVFGLAYGREAPSIAEEFDIPVTEAEAFIAEFFKAIPAVVAWRKRVTNFKGGQALQTHFGRKRRFWLITKDNRGDTEREALSFIPQAVTMDICTTAACVLYKSWGDGKDRPRLRIPVHDSLLAECRENQKVEVAEEMRETMSRVAREEYSDYVPFPVDIGFGYSWGELTDVIE